MRGSFLWVVFAVCSCGGGEDPGETEDRARYCERMRDHMVALRLADATGIDRDAYRTLMRDALGTDFIARCSSTMSLAQIDCVLEAPDAAAAAACSSTTR